VTSVMVRGRAGERAEVCRQGRVVRVGVGRPAEQSLSVEVDRGGLAGMTERGRGRWLRSIRKRQQGRRPGRRLGSPARRLAQPGRADKTPAGGARPPHLDRLSSRATSAQKRTADPRHDGDGWTDSSWSSPNVGTEDMREGPAGSRPRASHARAVLLLGCRQDGACRCCKLVTGCRLRQQFASKETIDRAS